MDWKNYYEDSDKDTDSDTSESFSAISTSLDEENHHGDYDMDEISQQILPVKTQKGRKNIRHIKELEDLRLDTRIANHNERERLSRIENCQKKFNEILGGKDASDELILDYDFVNNKPLVSVHKALVEKMKDHQREGVKFMWNACYESLKQIKESEGSGCIIAHCMGLGKTFQVIALVHTLLSHADVKTRTVLICCPKNTLINWLNEFHKWITPELGTLDIYNPTKFDNNSGRLGEIIQWQSNGGVCVLNYELMRILLENTKEKTKSFEHLCNPGPDLVICDEGHVLKNEETKLAKVMSQIRTMRRIVLTGTPMQNNLKEYHCMVQFVKPNLLGTRKEFINMFVNPILNGQYENSLVEDVQLMKERSHILHKKLLGCVQRFDLSTLKSFLPEKQEYVISLALSESQINMYNYYLKNYSAKGDPNWKYDGVALFADYQSLQRIWTHPYTLKIYGDKHQEGGGAGKKKAKKKKKKSYDDESGEESTDSETFRRARFPLFWWIRFVGSDDIEDARQSNKLTVLLKILKECEDAEEKILVFSGSLYSLELIQHFLKRINKSEFEDPALCNMTSTWEEESDYVVLTGQTSSEDRDRYCKSFNDLHNQRLRLFLISTKAGGMGINLTAANRAILFDVSWNPSHDIQSIFRIYRIGQKRPCFVYRFVASGTMEEKIYERQVAKESISYRVVDEKQIARHYTQNELLQLYVFEPNKDSKMKNVEPKDPIFLKVFQEESDRIIGIHEHDSLLEHKKEEELEELEKNDAWTAYNNDDDLENIPIEERIMLSQLTPESFDPKYLKMALKEEFLGATEEEITEIMREIKPRIDSILERPDFIDLMKKQALLHHSSRRPKRKNPKTKKRRRHSTNNKKTGRGKENATITLTDSPIAKPGTSGSGYYSESDDSVFMYDIVNKRKKGGKEKKPLKVWGVRNGRPFGSPDRDV